MALSQAIVASSGPYGGMPPPRPISTMGIFPYGYNGTTTGTPTLTLTANRCYIVPFPIFRTQSFSGFQFMDSGTGNNGKNIRTAIYAESASGGPGSLLKDFGAVGLTGTAALHQAANAVTIAGPQMCYVELVSDSTPVMQGMDINYYHTNAGYETLGSWITTLGDIGGASIAAQPFIGWYASLTYGAFPSTSVTPATNISKLDSGRTALPAMQLYV